MNLFKEGDQVTAPSRFYETPKEGKILSIKNGIYAYIRFFGEDKRLDEWVPLIQLAHVNSNKEKRPELSKRLDFKKSASEKTKNSEVADMRNIDSIRFGEYEIDAWYYSPYPLSNIKSRHLYICEYCLQYFESPSLFVYHTHDISDCKPIGYEIYRFKNLSIFEVTSDMNRIYCQSLYLFNKLFVEESTLSYNVDNTSFYVLCECDQDGAHFVGFFSRPTNWMSNIIISELLILPPFQRKGYSQILLSCAYELAFRSYVVGGPGRSFTDLGFCAFNKFFKEKVIQILINEYENIETIDDIVLRTSICRNDVTSILQKLNILGEDEFEKLSKDKINELLSNYQPDETAIQFNKSYLMWFTEEFEEDFADDDYLINYLVNNSNNEKSEVDDYSDENFNEENSFDALADANKSEDCPHDTNKSEDCLHDANKSEDYDTNKSEDCLHDTNKSEDYDTNKSEDYLHDTNKSEDYLADANKSEDYLADTSKSEDCLHDTNKSEDYENNETNEETNPPTEINEIENS